MEAVLTQTMFEWLLAKWAGFTEDPGKVFPSLHNADLEALENELNQTIDEIQH